VLEALRDLPDGAAFAVTVAGTSMEPALREGDAIGVERCGAGRLRLGDLAVIDLPAAGLVVHRVVWLGRTGVRTRGDGSGTMDPPIPADRVLGRVVTARRHGRDVLPGGARRLARWGWSFAAAALRHGRRRVEMALGDAGSRRRS
jgi:hypothetical protein